MPDYTLDAHTKPHGFHVEVVCEKIFYQVRSIIRDIAQIRKATQITYGMEINLMLIAVNLNSASK